MKGNFQIIILVLFIIGAVFGVLVFSGAIPINDKSKALGLGTVVLWGTVKSEMISPLLDEFNAANPTFSVRYVQKQSESFGQDLLEALASGQGPDMFFLPENLAFSYKNKIFTIPYQNYPQATFKSNFIGASEVFTTSAGILAFPVAVDPMVMYYNRSILDANNIVKPPVYWDEFASLVPTLTQKDDTNKITKSTIALGQFGNINYAKDILATMFMQADNPIIYEKDGTFYSSLDQANTKYGLGKVLQFYTDFSNPIKDVYSWNRSLPTSRDAFSAENLAFYFGYASEFKSLVNKNPNQNFMVAPMPQLRGSTFKLTNGHVMGIAISSASKNFNTALTAASLMAVSDFASKFGPTLGMVPVRRDLFTKVPADSYSPIFYSSALFARGWLDPSSSDTNDIFRGMIEKVISGSLSYDDSVRDANSKMGFLLFK